MTERTARPRSTEPHSSGDMAPFALTVTPALLMSSKQKTPVSPPRAGVLVAWLALASFALATSCTPPDPRSPTRPLPSYAGHATELFDDVLEPNAVGIELDPTDPRSDRLLRERTQVGDSTMRVRVTTITAKDDDGGSRYVMGVKLVAQLAGLHPFGETLELTVDKSSPSAGIFKTLEGQIVGKTFIAFIREFVRPDGDHELHFHIAPDSKVEAQAVSDAAALGAL